jgi:hypothetical protein
MKEVGRLGGLRRTRKGWGGGQQLSATLRERLRSAIDEDRLAAVLVEGLESANARERLDVAKLVLAELAEGQKRAERCICHTGKPGDFCAATSAHGYIRERMQFGLEELVACALESGLLEVEGEVRLAGIPVTRSPGLFEAASRAGVLVEG